IARTNLVHRQIQISLLVSLYHLALGECLKILCLYLCFHILVYIAAFCTVWFDLNNSRQGIYVTIIVIQKLSLCIMVTFDGTAHSFIIKFNYF
ncbi:MAG: hypothetical protein NC247_10445, partial [Ruminococcus flavefaciens]|nr:hypothetical protein [Ruminococcus flavefaciens]MCM1361004.1 hypothetical protein [Clostridiales bacterium]